MAQNAIPGGRMRVAGMTIKGKTIAISVLDSMDKNYEYFKTIPKLEISDSDSQEELKQLAQSLNAFIGENQIDIIYIKKRGKKGEYAGGADSFKIEAVIQLLNTSVVLLAPTTIASSNKGITVKGSESIFGYQEDSLKTAYAGMAKNAKNKH